MRKRILCLLCSILIAVQICPSVFAKTQNDSENSVIDVLKDLNIWVSYNTDEFRADRLMYRSEYIKSILNILSENTSTDINISKEQAEFAQSLNIISDADNIDAQRPIKLEEAAKVSVNALGYKELADKKGGYPYGHLYVANMLSLLNGINADKDGYLTRQDAAVLIYRTLNASPFVEEAYDGNGNVIGKAFGNETLISYYRDIYSYEGIVTATPFSGLYGEDGCGNELIEIEGNIYYSTVRNSEKYLGMYVKYYVYKKTASRKTVVCIEPSDFNETLTLRCEDIFNVAKDFKSVGYYNETDAEKTAKIDAGAAFVYNGVLYRDYKEEDFISKDGYVTFIDNNFDSRFDVVKIYNPEKMLVENASEIYNKIVNFVISKTSLKNVTLSEGDFKIELNGEEISINQIQKYDVLDVYIPKQIKNTHISISVTRSDISGKADSADDDGIYIGDNYYEYSQFYLDNKKENNKYTPEITIGNSYRIFVDSFNNIAAAILAEDDITYALATKLYLSEGVKPQLEIKALTLDDEWVKLSVAEKTYLDIKKYEDEEELYNDLGGETFIPQILKLKIKSNGEVSKIETAIRTEEIGRSDFTYKPLQKENFYSANLSFKDNIYLDASSRIFVKFFELTGEDEFDYFVTNTSFLKNTYQYPFVAYNLDEYNFTNMIYIEIPETYQVVLNQEIGGMIVEKAGKKVNSDGEREGYIYGGYGSYGLTELVSCEEGTFDDVKKGDFIMPVLDTQGRVKSYTKIYSLSEGEKEEYPDTTYERYGVVKGKIQKADIQNKRVVIGSQNKPYRWINNSAPVYIYSKIKQTVTKADTSALTVDDYVIMHYVRSNLKEIVIVR
ncbi:MAG: hypothetical protein MRZ29_05265 [Oscillospiraceae bacterium]|nr:hypothetical protein [Oscillospiraceae bacterium]